MKNHNIMKVFTGFDINFDIDIYDTVSSMVKIQSSLISILCSYYEI